MKLLRALLSFLGVVVRGLFGAPRRTRNVSMLAADGDASPDDGVEVVSTEPVPMKPGHRRLTYRDPRLLPKKKPALRRYVYPAPKRKRFLERAEADRLFSTTLRTRNRDQRDLACDPEQLARYGLPCWQSEAELAAALELSVGELRHFSIHRQRETSPHYVTFAIPKRSGGERLIHAPKRRLKAVQRRLHAQLVSKLPVAPEAHGFRPGLSVASNAAPHVGKKVVLKLDLRDCFPTIHHGRVRGLLVALGYSYPVATALSVLMTEPPRQPVELDGKLYHVPVGPRVCTQGAPTSPGLCNAVLLRMDRRLAGLARKLGFAYTRYADDLTFSGDAVERVRHLLSLVPKIVAEEGFAIHRDKTRVMRGGQRQSVTGVVVNQQRGLSRQERRRLRAEIHRAMTQGIDAGALRRLRGRLAYLHMLNPDQAAPLLRAVAALEPR